MTAETDTRPHSRACGWKAHPHGCSCAVDCPTCHGRHEPVRCAQCGQYPDICRRYGHRGADAPGGEG